MLKEANLQVNESKTEEYAIPLPERNQIINEHSYTKQPETNRWKKCKLLGSYIDTETDIKQRKSKIIHNMKNSRHLPIKTSLNFKKSEIFQQL